MGRAEYSPTGGRAGEQVLPRLGSHCLVVLVGVAHRRIHQLHRVDENVSCADQLRAARPDDNRLVARSVPGRRYDRDLRSHWRLPVDESQLPGSAERVQKAVPCPWNGATDGVVLGSLPDVLRSGEVRLAVHDRPPHVVGVEVSEDHRVDRRAGHAGGCQDSGVAAGKAVERDSKKLPVPSQNASTSRSPTARRDIRAAGGAASRSGGFTRRGWGGCGCA